jgi:adenine-specific DNA-methyltransferase
VDYEGVEPQPLPNLDYKIESGDSVSSPTPETLQMGIHQQLVNQMLTLKKSYLSSHHGEKPALRQQIEQLREEVLAFSLREAVTFDWVLDFAEIFSAGGFDIVIANPPYRKERDAKHLMEAIKSGPLWGEWSEGKMDLWYFFLHRALELVKPNGMVHFITSRYWIGSAGAKKLIRRLESQTAVRVICDFGDYPVFENVAGQHMTAMYQKTTTRPLPLTIRMNTDTNSFDLNALLSDAPAKGMSIHHYPSERRVFEIPGVLSIGTEMSTQGIDNTQVATLPLESLFEVRQGIAQNPDRVSRKAAEKYNLTAGEGVFVLTTQELKQLRLTSSEKIFVKSFVEEREIERFACAPHGGKWLLYLTTHNISSLSKYPQLASHLKKFRQIMDARRETVSGSNKWFHLHWPREERLFSGPKIVTPQMCSQPTFAYNDQECCVGLSSTVIKSRNEDDDLFVLLGILNSDAAFEWFSRHAKERGVGLDIGGAVLRSFPIPSDLHAPDSISLRNHSQLLYKKVSTGNRLTTDDLATLNKLVSTLYRLEAIENA